MKYGYPEELIDAVATEVLLRAGVGKGDAARRLEAERAVAVELDKMSGFAIYEAHRKAKLGYR